MRKILIILALVLAFATPWLLVGAEAWADMTGWPKKVFECASVVTFWGALLLMVASKEGGEKCRQDIV